MCNERDNTRAIGRRLKLGVLLLIIASTAACSGAMPEDPQTQLGVRTSDSQHRVAGEYIVTVQPGGDAALLRQLYAAYGVRDISDFGKNRFLIKLNQDPGLTDIERTGIESGKVKAVQPNYVYRLNRP